MISSSHQQPKMEQTQIPLHYITSLSFVLHRLWWKYCIHLISIWFKAFACWFIEYDFNAGSETCMVMMMTAVCRTRKKAEKPIHFNFFSPCQTTPGHATSFITISVKLPTFFYMSHSDFIELYACYPLLSVSLSHSSFDTSITRQLFGWLVAWYKFHIKKLCMRVSVCDANILYIWWWMEKSFRFLIYLVRWCVLLSLARIDECNVYYGLYWCFFLNWIAI